MLVIFNRHGEMIAFSEGGILQVRGTGPDQDKVRSWIDNGVPSMQGALVGPTSWTRRSCAVRAIRGTGNPFWKPSTNRDGRSREIVPVVVEKVAAPVSGGYIPDGQFFFKNRSTPPCHESTRSRRSLATLFPNERRSEVRRNLRPEKCSFRWT